jgi:hypothetical protein
MRIVRSGLMFSGVHLLLVITAFMAFGLGLEGKRSVGHDLLWFLLEPAASLPGAPLALVPLNSALWGFAFAVALESLRRLRAR